MPPHLAPSPLRRAGESLVLAHEVGVDVLPRGHEVALGALAPPAQLLFRPSRVVGGAVRIVVGVRRERGAAAAPGLRLHVTPQVSSPRLGQIVPVCI